MLLIKRPLSILVFGALVALLFGGTRSVIEIAEAQAPTLVPTVALTGTMPAYVTAVPPVFSPIDPARRALALATPGGFRIGEIELPGPSLYVDFNPIDPQRYARVDSLGMLRFVPQGAGEGVYSFAPYFDGFTTGALADNRLAVAEVAWSPNGQMLAFRIASGDPAANDGIWFWQPARDIGTDPSYHLLRDCPPGCMLVERRNVQEWRALDLAWSSDNQAILVNLELPQNNRRGIAVVQAVRDPETRQSRIGPEALFYDYGTWAGDGQRIVVSGRGPDGTVLFGTIARDGSTPFLTAAASVGLAWVQHAAQQPATGQIVMLGAVGGSGSALQLYDSAGTALTGPIGNGAPQQVRWSPDRSAVWVTVGEGINARHYIAGVDGSLRDITDHIGPTLAVNWTAGELPPNARTQDAPLPSGVILGSAYRPGQQLRVYVDQLNLHTEPRVQANVLGSIGIGEYVVILAGPVEADNVTWWRVQTTAYTGWIGGVINGITTLGP